MLPVVLLPWSVVVLRRLQSVSGFGDEAAAAGTLNTNLGATKYEFGGMYFAFFTVNTAKYSPKYFRICKYGPYLAFLPQYCTEMKPSFYAKRSWGTMRDDM